VGISMDSYYEMMRSKGFSRNTTDSLRKFKCPNCGFEFSITYARTFACRGCPQALNSCPKVRCAKCDHEFFIKDTPNVGNKYRQRQLADHMNNILVDYYDGYGWKKSR
jgi:DNA-directed RNA polymerase subunit RPC12/RpoP